MQRFTSRTLVVHDEGHACALKIKFFPQISGKKFFFQEKKFFSEKKFFPQISGKKFFSGKKIFPQISGNTGFVFKISSNKNFFRPKE